MALKDRLGSLEATSPIRRCSFAEFIMTLDADDAAALTNILSSRVPTRKIHTELQEEGYRIGRDSISNHRNGWCRCPKDDQ
jgi:hypothetical protein